MRDTLHRLRASRLLDPDGQRAIGATKLPRAVGAARECASDGAGDVAKHPVWAAHVHALRSAGTVGEHDRHTLGMLGVARARPADEVAVVEVVGLRTIGSVAARRKQRVEQRPHRGSSAAAVVVRMENTRVSALAQQDQRVGVRQEPVADRVVAAVLLPGIVVVDETASVGSWATSVPSKIRCMSSTPSPRATSRMLKCKGKSNSDIRRPVCSMNQRKVETLPLKYSPTTNSCRSPALPRTRSSQSTTNGKRMCLTASR